MKVLKAAVEGGALSNSIALEEVLSMTIEHILPVTQSNTVDIDIVYALFELFGRFVFIIIFYQIIFNNIILEFNTIGLI